MTNQISVVIPTLNRPSMERAITSAATQSLPPSEIIVVSNGSERIDDERKSRLTRQASPIPLRILSLPPFSGPSICRNLGAWEAKTSHIAFLDDDDEFTPRYLEFMWSRITDESPDVLYGSKVWHNSDGTIQREKRIHTVPEHLWLETLYKHENPGFGGTNVVVRKDFFFRVGGFPTDLPSGEDRAFAMEAMVAKAHIVYVDEAEVTCHDPDGYRANMRSDKWITNLKLISRHWGDVGPSIRLCSAWRLLRSLVRRQLRVLKSWFRLSHLPYFGHRPRR